MKPQQQWKNNEQFTSRKCHLTYQVSPVAIPLPKNNKGYIFPNKERKNKCFNAYRLPVCQTAQIGIGRTLMTFNLMKTVAWTTRRHPRAPTVCCHIFPRPTLPCKRFPYCRVQLKRKIPCSVDGG